MKYIRTKDGVYELVDNLYQYHNGVEKFWYAKEENGTTLAIEITANKILNQSENLYELCDLFIDEETKTIFHKHNGYVINWKTNMVYSLKALSESYHSVKGAIYTDKGLIYVAKMNEKGELELI